MIKDKDKDIFYILDRLRKKNINHKFLQLIEDQYTVKKTLSPTDLYQLRKVTYRELKIWFSPDWAKDVLVLKSPAYRGVPVIKGDREGAHIFYKKPGRKKD